MIKWHLITRYMERHGLDLADAAVQMIDLQYHDIDPVRGLFNSMSSGGFVRRVVTDAAVDRAREHAPTDTRAHLRGQFIKAAKAAGKDYTVDWVHLKLNDLTQRTIVCNDPFRSQDERVERLIESL